MHNVSIVSSHVNQRHFCAGHRRKLERQILLRIFFDGEVAELASSHFASQEAAHVPASAGDDGIFETFGLDVVGDPSLVCRFVSYVQGVYQLVDRPSKSGFWRTPLVASDTDGSPL